MNIQLFGVCWAFFVWLGIPESKPFIKLTLRRRSHNKPCADKNYKHQLSLVKLLHTSVHSESRRTAQSQNSLQVSLLYGRRKKKSMLTGAQQYIFNSRPQRKIHELLSMATSRLCHVFLPPLFPLLPLLLHHSWFPCLGSACSAAHDSWHLP